MKYHNAIALKEAKFPEHSGLYGTCAHVDDVGFDGNCGCDFMLKIVSNPTINELLEKCCPEFESMSFAPGETKEKHVWVVSGKLGRKRRLFDANHADDALAAFWLAKQRYYLSKTKTP